MKQYKQYDWLYEHYVNKYLSSKEIATMCGIKSEQTILNWLEKHQIPRRDCHDRRKTTYFNTCEICGTKFEVPHKGYTNPNNVRKFKRCCSKECTSRLLSKNLKERYDNGFDNNAKKGPVSFLDKDVIIQKFCYEHKKLIDISKELRVKPTTLQREFERHGIKREFFRNCPQCSEYFSCSMRSMVDPNSNKFKKFCSRSCFLSSRQQTDTWIERITEEFLLKNNIPYIKQYEIKRMTVDFILEGTNIIVEANGDFWHANPSIYGKTKPLHRFHDKVIKKDERKLSQLHELGYVVLTVWEYDLQNNLETTLSDLLTKIKDAV